MHVFIHLRSPWGYVWMCYFGSQPGAMVKNRLCSWPKCELPKRLLHMTMPHVLRVLQLLGFPDSARFLLCPATVSLLRQQRNYRHTHYLSLVVGSLPDPETVRYSGYQWENWRQAAWVCLLALPLTEYQVHLSGPLFLPVWKENINST